MINGNKVWRMYRIAIGGASFRDEVYLSLLFDYMYHCLTNKSQGIRCVSSLYHSTLPPSPGKPLQPAQGVHVRIRGVARPGIEL